MWIAYVMDRIGPHQDEMWDEQDGLFYHVLRLPDGRAMRLKVRSMVGLLPLCTCTVIDASLATAYPKLLELIELFKKTPSASRFPRAPTDKGFLGYKDRRLLSILNKKLLA